MKKILLMMLLFVGSFSSFAQNWQEVVYLKNGSVIRGIVVEQQPGVSLKIQTADGSLFVFQMSEVEKITKELPKQETSTNKSNYRIVSVSEEVASVSIEKQKTRGYKGFVDGGFTVGDYDVAMEVNTSHGFQINPYFYVGGGLGLHAYMDYECLNIPIFSNVRVNFLNKKASPYVDYKLGVSIGDFPGFYSSLSVGCKIKKFNVSLGYTVQLAEVYDYYYDYYSGGYYNYYTDNIGGFTLKAGFEF